MPSRMIAVVLLVASLTIALVSPAAAQGSDSEYAIRDVSLISEGEERSFYRVETYEQGLSNDQADELCMELGFDEAIGIDRERYSGKGYPRAKYDVVTCAGQGTTATAQAGAILVFSGTPILPIPALVEVYVADERDVLGPEGSCAGAFVDDGETSFVPASFELEVGTTYCFNAISGIGFTEETSIVDQLTVSQREDDNFIIFYFNFIFNFDPGVIGG